MSKKEVNLFDLYVEDPEKADRIVFGRIPNADRRGFLKGAGLATMAAMLGGFIPFHRNMPSGFIPAALAEEPFSIEGKDGLTILNDRPVNAECPAHLLDDEVTPTSRHFVRNNGVPPESVDAATWTLTVDGEVHCPANASICKWFLVYAQHHELAAGAEPAIPLQFRRGFLQVLNHQPADVLHNVQFSRPQPG